MDQENTAERNQQSPIMKEIYSNADKVLSWLGPPVAGSADLFKLSKLADSDGLDRDMAEQLFLRLHGSQDRFWIHTALEDFVKKSYWSRLWIVQELILGKEIVLYCASHNVALTYFTPKAFLEVVKLFKSKRYSKDEQAKLGAGCHSRNYASSFEEDFPQVTIYNYLRWRGGRLEFFPRALSLTKFESMCDSEMTLLQAMKDFGRNKCLDPRDRVYALLGFVKKSPQQSKIIVNYGQNLVGLFFDVWAYIDQTEIWAGPKSIRPFARRVFQKLGLQDYIAKAEPGDLRKDVVESIPLVFREKRFPIAKWHAGKLKTCDNSESTSTSPANHDRPRKDGNRPNMAIWTVTRALNHRYEEFFSLRRGVEFVCFTLTHAKCGDIIIGLDGSNCGMIARKVPSQSPGPYGFVGRCVFARSSADSDGIARFLHRELPYCSHLVNSEGIERPSSEGVGQDFLILSTDFDPDFMLGPAWTEYYGRFDPDVEPSYIPLSRKWTLGNVLLLRRLSSASNA